MVTRTYDKLVSVTVDVQNDFLPGGSLAVPNGDEVIKPLNELNDYVRRGRGRVFLSRDWHPRNSTHFVENGGDWPVHCVQYTAGAAFPDSLVVKPEVDTVINKGFERTNPGYSAFGTDTDFDNHRGGLFNNLPGHYEHVMDGLPLRYAFLIGGLATDYCVRATTLDALRFAEKMGDRVGIFVVRNAIRAVNLHSGDEAVALDQMQAAGASLVTSEQIMAGEAFVLAH